MPGALHLDKTFFGLHLYSTGKYCKNPIVPGAQLSVNPARAKTWFVGVTIYCTFFNNNSPPPRQFLCKKYFWKKIRYGEGNAHWTNFWIERAWAPWPYTPITGCFHDKTIISKENFRVDCYSLSNIAWGNGALLPPTWTKSLTKFNPKMQDFKRVLDLNCKQKENWTT